MLLEKAKKKDFSISKFIDYEREKCVFYDNIYLDEEKLVIKQAIVCKRSVRDEICKGIKLEKFNLAKYTFLTSYE
ncbi:MAG: hypothetical protein R6U96_15155 [Promethearchaeia archaeon]